ncbi:restriction endonuclease subunit S [Acinetobacter sp. P1(2025)]|uniref:restriction endonuclease subunit S n=1 Tax=Acinetobacter sp. P1(2025) TaxID=3446120 RepID=UPI003F535CB7
MSEQKIPQGYKQTEIGVIPDDWEIDKIGNVVSITTGDKNTQDKVTDGLYPFFVRSQQVEKINSFSFDGEAVLTAGDGVGTGKIFHYINGKFDFHQRVYLMHNFSEKLNGYYFYIFFSNHFYDRIMSMTAKSSVDSVRREMIADMQIILPSKYEQTLIATALSDVDTLISELEKLITKKQAIKTATMQQLLTGKARLPQFALREDGTRKGYKQSELGEVPEDWDVKTYGEVFTFLSTSTNSRDDLSSDGDLGYIHYGDIHTKWNNRLDLDRQKLPKISRNLVSSALILDGDLIMADASEDYQGIGKSVEIFNIRNKKIVAGLHTFLLRDKNKILADGFRGYLHAISTVKAAFDRLATGLKVYGISKNNLTTIFLPVPSIEEQTAIATILSDLDSEIQTLEQRLVKTRQIKQGMMQELLTGKTRLLQGTVNT